MWHPVMPAGNKLSSKSASIATLSAPDEREAKRISNAIDRRLAAERAALAKDRTAKLLILGAGESGKTTVSESEELELNLLDVFL